ncbi:hypothetical protein [Pajaroellobacter abortibovis]|uniref:Uncharacterized protein n=1 Tax=Pajaroellobacter abortibovis TaxID=1882918 RepID=A0A1L6MWJ2_9BACT|nr:hypothetical protein [Pajaroellobacter abortibovis]APR99891.1 hypothetical protein BCY86_03760 [Pajaroellobacter abortibovis]
MVQASLAITLNHLLQNPLMIGISSISNHPIVCTQVALPILTSYALIHLLMNEKPVHAAPAIESSFSSKFT